jgi:hypothetical protein
MGTDMHSGHLLLSIEFIHLTPVPVLITDRTCSRTGGKISYRSFVAISEEREK